MSWSLSWPQIGVSVTVLSASLSPSPSPSLSSPPVCVWISFHPPVLWEWMGGPSSMGRRPFTKILTWFTSTKWSTPPSLERWQVREEDTWPFQECQKKRKIVESWKSNLGDDWLVESFGDVHLLPFFDSMLFSSSDELPHTLPSHTQRARRLDIVLQSSTHIRGETNEKENIRHHRLQRRSCHQIQVQVSDN